MRTIDPDLLKGFVLKVWTYKQGEMVSLMVHLGLRLGLYASLSELKAATAGELAAARDLDERWVSEWLHGQAAAGLVARSDDARFSLDPEAEEVLVNVGSLAYAAAAFTAPETPDAIETTLEAFRTGRGVTYDAMGADLAEAIDSQNIAWLGTYLPEVVIPELEGVADRLEAGAVVADIGCGGGVSTEALARRYPKSTFVGIEPSRAAVAFANERLKDLDNASVIHSFGEDLEGEERFDLVMTLDCMHDVPFPDRIAAAIRPALKSDGTWLIKDMRASSDWDKSLKNPTLALQYGYSITSCLASATSEEGGAALGTLGFTPEVANEIATNAGFTRIRSLNLRSDPVHQYYEVRP